MECRQSGLSDYQWCQRQEINVDTFYNWGNKLRKAGYTIPEPKSKSEELYVACDNISVTSLSDYSFNSLADALKYTSLDIQRKKKWLF